MGMLSVWRLLYGCACPMLAVFEGATLWEVGGGGAETALLTAESSDPAT